LATVSLNGSQKEGILSAISKLERRWRESIFYGPESTFLRLINFNEVLLKDGITRIINSPVKDENLLDGRQA
jgi:hypothetical protein